MSTINKVYNLIPEKVVVGGGAVDVDSVIVV